MIKIGDFSNLAHVSIKTLHHYDELGLLRPAHIDRFSGYRYYALQQLARLNRILALKDLGLSLEQIAQLLRDDISPAEMRGMLRLKRMELEAHVDEEQARLLRVEQRLRQLEQEASAVPAEIAVKQVPAQTALLAHIVAADESMVLRAREGLQDMLHQHLEQARLKPAGPWFALMDRLPYADVDREITLGVPVALRGTQRAGDWEGTPIRLQELAAVPNMASLIHNAEHSYTSLYAWTQANGYRVAGPFRELYLPESGMSASLAGEEAGLIEVQCPVERASVPASIQSRKDKSMQPNIIEKPAFKTVGFSYIGKTASDEISQMWDRFLPRIDEPQRSDPHTAYGLCIMDAELQKKGDFEYVAAVEVPDGTNIPAGMVYREVPAHKYAVFTHHGKLDNLRETFDYIFSTALPQAGLQPHPSGFDMEVYAEDFKPGADDSKMYIYVALQ